MSSPSDYEQFLLEQVNFARLDPQADFDRYMTSYEEAASDNPDIQMALDFFSVVGSTLKEQIDSLDAVAPVAWNGTLTAAAKVHSERMIAKDAQYHVDGTDTPGARITEAGYTWSTFGENVYAYGKDAVFTHAGFMVDWGSAANGAIDGIQNPAGHRDTIMKESFREIGISAVEENDASTGVGPFVVTQNFASRLDVAEAILLGHVRSETDDDGFYSMGEGTGGVTISIAKGNSMVTEGAGGYALDASAGGAVVTFSGGGLEKDVSVKATLKAENAKIDLVDGTKIMTTVSLKLKSGAEDAAFIADQGTKLVGNGGDNMLTGNDLKNNFKGKGGADVLLGAGGNDVLKGNGGSDVMDGGADDDVLTGAGGNDTMTGGSGNDKFVFKGKFGDDEITDLSDGDTVSVKKLAESKLSASLTVTGDDVLFEKGQNSILFKNVELSDLTPDVFGF